MTATKAKYPRTFQERMNHVVENVKRNKAFQLVGRFFTNAEQAGTLDAMSIAEVKEKVRELGLDQPRYAELSVKSSPAPATAKPSALTSKASTPNETQLSATISAQSEQIASLTAQVKQLAATVVPAKTRDLTKLQASYLAAFGKDRYAETLNRNKFDAAMDLMERQIYLNGLEIPGYDFAPIEARFGQPKALHGLRRMEASQMQAKINTCLTRFQ